MTEPNVTAILCALNDHPPVTSRNQADSMPRPAPCGCGERTYSQQGFVRVYVAALGDQQEPA
jgi:hypothetical protein